VPEEKVHTKDETVTNYHFPQAIGSRFPVVPKRKLPPPALFCFKDRGKEQWLKQRSITTENWFSYNRWPGSVYGVPYRPALEPD
jgi:hypothetical protein